MVYFYCVILGFAKNSKKDQNDTSSCSKRFLNRHMYTDDDMSLYSYDDVYGADTYENTTSQPITASLADFCIPSNNKIHKRLRKWYGNVIPTIFTLRE